MIHDNILASCIILGLSLQASARWFDPSASGCVNKHAQTKKLDFVSFKKNINSTQFRILVILGIFCNQ